MLATNRTATEQHVIDCDHCEAMGYMRNENRCPLCLGERQLVVTIAAGLDDDGPRQDAIVDAVYNLEIAKGLRRPDISAETAAIMNAQMKADPVGVECHKCTAVEMVDRAAYERFLAYRRRTGRTSHWWKCRTCL